MERFCEVVPAERFTAVRLVATEAVSRVELESPNEMPFEFPNETVPVEASWVPALIAMPDTARLMMMSEP